MNGAARATAGLIATALLMAWATYAIGALAHARRAREEARGATAPLRLSSTRALVASDAHAAGLALARLLGDRASAAGIRVLLAPAPTRGTGDLVRFTLDAQANEQRLNTFAAAIETARGPQVRLVTWSIEAYGGRAARLRAEAAAPWTTSPAQGVAAVHLPDPSLPPPVPPGRALFAEDAPADIRPAADAPPELAGIAGRLPDDAVALLRLADGGTHGLRRGESVAGWRVTRIDADRVHLARGREERVLVLPPR